ncbi:MAG TPA: TolC family protein [Candidatus Acidoferrales bacterium]|nr:TolC family protein [Candidatus Acidoferrales bacterium]
MKPNAALFVLAATGLSVCIAVAQEISNTAPPPRQITLQEAVQLALKHNHDIRIAGYTVEEKEHAKQVAKSSYFPSIRNDSSFMHATDTELIQIRPGSLGIAAGTPIPPADAIISQGGKNFTTSGTQITQPLTSLLKIRQANNVAQAELKASREKAQLTGNDVALSVHQVYYQILIAQAHRSATEARIKASEALQSERVEQVKFGSSLEENLIDSRAQQLQAKQELLTTDFQLTDLKLKLNDLIGLPLSTALGLDPGVPEFQETCRREECVTTAEASQPEILAARAQVEAASAAVRLAKTDIWVPDVEVFARYSYQENVPFLARNFGTFGVHFGYDLFDSGRKKALMRERQAQLSQAKENLAKLTDAVELSVETAYNKLERTQLMLKVSEEVLALRTESNRVRQQELVRGAALNSQADAATAQEYDAKALLLQSQMDYLQAHDELLNATGSAPE